MAGDERGQQVVQDLTQRYGRDNRLVWGTEKSAVLRRGGEGGMALGVGDGVAWLERAEESLVPGHVQAMGAEGIRLPDKLLRGFRAMMLVLQNHPPVRTDDSVLPPSSTQCGDRVHLLYWRVQLQEVGSEVRGLIRGYQGIPTEVPRCVLRSLTAYYEKGISTAGEVYRAHGARALNRMCHNQEEVVRRGSYHAVAEVQREEIMCRRFVWHRRWRLTAGKRKRMWRVLQAVLPGEEHMLANNRKCGRCGPILLLDTDHGGAVHGTVRWVMKEGVTLEVMQVRRKDMKEYQRAGLHHGDLYREKEVVEWGVYTVGNHKEGEKSRGRGKGRAREGAIQGRKRKGKDGHPVVCSAGTERTKGEGTKCKRAVVRCTCSYVPEQQHPGGARVL